MSTTKPPAAAAGAPSAGNPADIAREAGLEPLTDKLIENPTADPAELAEHYKTEGFEDTKKALEGARAILITGFDANKSFTQEVLRPWGDVLVDPMPVVGIVENHDGE